MKYYIEITDYKGENKIAGEYICESLLSDIDLQEAIIEFAVDEGICPSMAISNCLYKIEE